MSENPPIQSTIESYRKRRGRKMPTIIAVVAGVLVLAGIIILVLALAGGGKGGFNLFATRTPTPTITPSPTNTLPPTETPTITSTPTQTASPTPSAPFYYVVLEGDYLSTIATKFNLGDNGVIMLLMLNPKIDPVQQVIYVGEQLLVPPPNWPMPTPTPWPVNAPRGTKISYFVMPGDNLGLIAAKFLSTVADIVKANPKILKDETTVIYPGYILVIPVNMVTAVPTFTSTHTPTATPTP